ncbi:MAG: hypothetical protein IJX55_02235 [Clostridia bacterium]|nr:hypothetical protein [Clostridia bacterium]
MNKKYFAAANTEAGFRSLFAEVFSPGELSRIYIIKGGPGTGKSTFMYGIASLAEERGLATEYYYCSADTGSLDGVKIPALGVAVLDGTSPHTSDPRYPGACETIVNLGQNFDVEKLREHRAQIEALTDECSACYKRSARFLRAAGEVERLRLDLAGKTFDFAKARKAARRLLSRAKPGGGEYRERYISALGTRGRAHIQNSAEKGEKIVQICGKYGAEKLFLRVLCEQAQAFGYTLLRHPDVLLHDYTEGLYIKELKTRYIITEESEEQINAMRFVNAGVLAANRAKLRFAEKCYTSVLDGALAELSEMGKKHDELEKFYVSAMDFEKSDAMRAQVEKEIFSELL